ncbi:c-type cytochrome [Novosphingobium sp. SG707]|uniref:c-type cytochrome n=1 Tax=Novosphingobium sp. SG707 TaxID=2586996 RepID=UPI0017D9FF7F|nr:c-type cytochrome [Novosphingobium sp. SG707]NKI98011.1 cytochrome c [Novosphingobium sp. SG707]
MATATSHIRTCPPHISALLGIGTGLALLAMSAAPAGAQPASSDAKLFAQQCGACHSTKPDENRVGPSLAGIMGRPAGKQTGFTYSPALKKSTIKWSPATLERWLTDSSQTIPGSVMNFRQADAAKRKAIIDYLSTLTAK